MNGPSVGDTSGAACRPIPGVVDPTIQKFEVADPRRRRPTIQMFEELGQAWSGDVPITVGYGPGLDEWNTEAIPTTRLAASTAPPVAQSHVGTRRFGSRVTSSARVWPSSIRTLVRYGRLPSDVMVTV